MSNAMWCLFDGTCMALCSQKLTSTRLTHLSKEKDLPRYWNATVEC